MDAQESTVTCHSGYRYAQRPQSFTWGGAVRQVAEVIGEAHTPTGRLFVVTTPEDERFTLTYDLDQDRWLVSQTGLNITSGGTPY